MQRTEYNSCNHAVDRLQLLHATMQWTDPDFCLLADAFPAGNFSCNSCAACIPATPAARLLLVAVLPCSSSSAKDEEEAAGWVWFWAGEAEEEEGCGAEAEEGWTEAGCSVGAAAEAMLSLLLLLVLVAGVLRATAELDRSVARSSS